MENVESVFFSHITKSGCEQKNNLYDLINIIPAEPLPCSQSGHETVNFTPNCNKQYIPKRGSKLKVQTVREIRTIFEEDVYSYLPGALEKQESYLLKRICNGLSTNEQTKKNAKNILTGNKPISRSAWQMLANINPENHVYPKQFVVWNGKRIQVNGSRGGKKKIIYNFDFKDKSKLTKPLHLKNSIFRHKEGLLRKSLNIKFRPGPLQKKTSLDESYHKYHLGKVEIIKLPTPRLEIYPSYGTALENTVTGLISNLRSESGVISPKWAEYAVSVLGKLKNNKPQQLNKNSCITFDLNYGSNQHSLLMRRDMVETESLTNPNIHFCRHENFSEESVNNEIHKVMKNIIDSVEISLLQDSLYSLDYIFNDSQLNDKPKRKLNELNRLDVTVIKLPQTLEDDNNVLCAKSSCMLGCICDSLDGTFQVRRHCGIPDCMFGCKCDQSKLNTMEFCDHDSSEMIPGLIKLGNELNSHLAKEEQKFHQTVIVTGERKILLKTTKRKCKATTKYTEYNKDDHVCNKIPRKILKIIDSKLNVKNIEPFCMVHNLYKCFCKGKFTDSSCRIIKEVNSTQIPKDEIKLDNKNDISDKTANSDIMALRLRQRRRNHDNSIKLDSRKEDTDDVRCFSSTEPECLNILTTAVKTPEEVINLDNKTACSDKNAIKSSRLRQRQLYQSYNNKNSHKISVDEIIPHTHFKHEAKSCSRAVGYCGRKYSDEFYKATNRKIKAMEEYTDEDEDEEITVIEKSNENIPQVSEYKHEPESVDNMSLYYDDSDSNPKSEADTESNSSLSFNTNSKYNLKAWILANYRTYKQDIAQGIVKTTLKVPRKGLSTLLSWSVILNRYRERKNAYFVTKKPPYRIFLANNPNNPVFANCINIDDIRFADLPKYSSVVQSLVTNVDRENYFGMLRGWDQCWELIGTVVKVMDDKNQFKSVNTFVLNNSNDDIESSGTTECDNNPSGETSHHLENDTSKSRWFVMKIENDFNELQFHKRGFFVTYEGIESFIKLARETGKTVRLSGSGQVRSDRNNPTQYGIYAIPSTSESCVFIGPYEETEDLGIEIIKTLEKTTNSEKTRGVWITTNKIDNNKVINNPLSFMPTVSTGSVNFNLGSEVTGDTKTMKMDDIKAAKKIKTIKPITIRRTNIIQRISPGKSILIKNPISLLKKGPVSASPSIAYVKPFTEELKQINVSHDNTVSNIPIVSTRPVAEIAPQIKITSVYSKSTAKTILRKGNSVQVLNPDEINKICLYNNVQSLENKDSSTEVEDFLRKSVISKMPEVLEISDCEDDITYTDVCIKCWNIPELGCIRGRMKSDQTISFKFPGFGESMFFKQAEAFKKINQVFAAKVYIPNKVRLKWKVLIGSWIHLEEYLTREELGDIRYVHKKLRKAMNVKKPKITSPSTSSGNYEEGSTSKEVIYISDLEDASNDLEKEGEDLMKQVVARQSESGTKLLVPGNMRDEMSGTLVKLLHLNNEVYAGDSLQHNE